MVVLGLVGPPRSGKRKLASVLRAERGFRLLNLGVPGGSLAITASQPGSPVLTQRITLGSKKEETLESTLGDCNSGKSSHKSNLSAYTAVGEVTGDHPQYDGETNGVEGRKMCDAPVSCLPSDPCKRTEYHSDVESVTFEGNVDALIDFVTQRWRDNFVVLGLTRLEQVNALRKRPFFALVAVDVPLGVRAACTNALQTPEALLEKLVKEDAVCFVGSETTDDGRSNGIRACMTVADVHVTSNGDLETLTRKISGMWLNEELVRPSWDTYFMRIAFLAATRSNCMKRRSSLPATTAPLPRPKIARMEAVHAVIITLYSKDVFWKRANAFTLKSMLFSKLLIKSVIYAEEYDKTSGALELFKRMGVVVHRFNDIHPGIPGETLAVRCV